MLLRIFSKYDLLYEMRRSYIFHITRRQLFLDKQYHHSLNFSVEVSSKHLCVDRYDQFLLIDAFTFHIPRFFASCSN